MNDEQTDEDVKIEKFAYEIYSEFCPDFWDWEDYKSQIVQSIRWFLEDLKSLDR